jgi:hypothetical protein
MTLLNSEPKPGDLACGLSPTLWRHGYVGSYVGKGRNVVRVPIRALTFEAPPMKRHNASIPSQVRFQKQLWVAFNSFA